MRGTSGEAGGGGVGGGKERGERWQLPAFLRFTCETMPCPSVRRHVEAQREWEGGVTRREHQ